VVLVVVPNVGCLEKFGATASGMLIVDSRGGGIICYFLKMLWCIGKYVLYLYPQQLSLGD
jgi:hypothetical protein